MSKTSAPRVQKGFAATAVAPMIKNEEAAAERRKNMKAAGYVVGTYDIETSPNLAYTFQMFNTNISLGQLVETSRILSWAGRIYGQKKVHFHSEATGTHQEMIEALWHFMNRADAVVTYNGKSFDDKIVEKEFFLAGLPKPTPYVDIDLLQVIRQMKFTSGKLDHISQQLGIGSKVAHEGFGLWRSCLEGDLAAWKRMRKYNEGDVVLTEDLYDMLLGRTPNHPTFNGSPYKLTCNQCGSASLTRNGEHRARRNLYDRYQCDVCHGHVVGTEIVGRMSAARGIK